MTEPQNLAKAGPVHPPDRMNKTEAAFAKELDRARRLGKVKRWWFEPCSFRLSGIQNWYKPDFIAVMADDTLIAYDVKGSWSMHGQDRQMVKIKTAATLYPCIRWIVVMKKRKKDGGGWKTTEFTDREEMPEDRDQGIR